MPTLEKNTSSEMMEAVLWTAYGQPEVLHYTKLPKPKVRANEILIKIRVATVTAGDCELRRFDIQPWIWLPVRLIMGVFKPRLKVLGQEFSGIVAQLGEKVHRFKLGDKVIVAPGINMGGYAEYKSVSAKKAIAIKPKGLSFEEAATIPTGGINALHFIRKAQLQPGQSILINGAGGSIGTYALQLAKMAGAIVTCVDRAEKLEMLLMLGADHVIDYTHDDFTKNGVKYDTIFDVVSTTPFSACINSLSPTGCYLIGNPSFSKLIKTAWTVRTGKKRVVVAMAKENKEDIVYLANLLANGQLVAFIDRHYSLKEVSEAHRYVETGAKNGNVVINIELESS